MIRRLMLVLAALGVALVGCHPSTSSLVPPSGPLAVGDHHATVGGADLAYHVFGQGPPCLVVPGGPGFEWNYLRMPGLEANFTMIYMEPVGTGASGRLADPALYTKQRVVDDIEGLRQQLGLKRFFLLGHSYGGFEVQLYAIAHPHVIRGLVLYSTAARADAELGKASDAAATRYEHESWYADATAAFDDEAKAQTDEEILAVVNRERPILFADWTGNQDRYEEALASMHVYVGPLKGSELEKTPFDVRAQLGRIDAPTLIVAGRLDAIFPPAFTEELQAGIHDAKLVFLEHSGHMGHIEERAEFDNAVTDFLLAQK